MAPSFQALHARFSEIREPTIPVCPRYRLPWGLEDRSTRDSRAETKAAAGLRRLGASCQLWRCPKASQSIHPKAFVSSERLVACQGIHTPSDTQTQTQTQTHRHTDTQTHRHTDTQTHRHTDTQTHRHRHTDTQTQTHRHTDTQTRRHTDTQTRRHTDTQTHRHTDTQTHRHTDTQTHRHRDTDTQTHTHTHRDTDTDTETDRHRDRQTDTHTHTHTHTHHDRLSMLSMTNIYHKSLVFSIEYPRSVITTIYCTTSYLVSHASYRSNAPI